MGKENPQTIASTPTNVRTRSKRLARRTICFATPERLHDLVSELFINRYEFGRPLS